jgi:hypothetical protein
MTILNCHDEMTDYHGDEVTLQKPDQDEMRERRNAGRTRLNTGLERDGHPLPVVQASQGSYAMRTMHQDEQTDYDIDDGQYFDKDDLQDADGVALTPYAARERACTALKQDDRLKYPAKIKDNCVRQIYPEGYHIDMPIYRVSYHQNGSGDEVAVYEHASGDEWVKSDARAVTAWYNGIVGELNSGQTDGSQLRRITRLTKKQARSRIAWKSKTTSGICMTKLVVDHFVASPSRDDESLHETWTAIHRKFVGSQHISHPVLTGQYLAEHGDAEVIYFRDRLAEALKTLQALSKDGCTRADARKAWDEVFGTTHFSDQPIDEDSSGGKKARTPFIVTSPDAAQRNDGDRRFG